GIFRWNRIARKRKNVSLGREIVFHYDPSQTIEHTLTHDIRFSTMRHRSEEAPGGGWNLTCSYPPIGSNRPHIGYFQGGEPPPFPTTRRMPACPSRQRMHSSIS